MRPDHKQFVRGRERESERDREREGRGGEGRGAEKRGALVFHPDNRGTTTIVAFAGSGAKSTDI
eukprot:3491394-Lingulodinium_polyedra.AAC.1